MNVQEIPKNDMLLQTAIYTFQSSDQTIALKSEQNRTVYAEMFETRSASSLGNLCLSVIAQNFKIHSINNLKIKPIQLRTFYDFIDENLPIDKCISIEDDYYWKRVYSSKCTDKLLLKQYNKQVDVSWKNLSITLKYIELIESTPYERWISEDMEEITKMVSPYVTELNISKLQAMRDASFKKQLEVSSKTSKSTITIRDEEDKDSDSNITEKNESTYDFSIEDSHHVDLSVFGSLLHLNLLALEFVPQKLSTNYHNRYFNFSYADMQNLARGILELKNLKIFKIRRSRMDSVKLSIILEALQSTFIEMLELYFCELGDDCGESLYEYLISTKSLKHLDLSGNNFKQQAIEYLSRGIKTSQSKLTHLGLSNNPFSDDSICNLTKTLEDYDCLKVLKLSGIQNSVFGAAGIANLVKQNSHLEELHIIAVRMDGAGLIEALKSNHKIKKILCQGCGLTLEEEFKVEILLKRNRYISLNPYIGDNTKTEEEIYNFIRKTKNPIFIRTLENLKERTKCLQHRSLRHIDAEKSKSLLD